MGGEAGRRLRCRRSTASAKRIDGAAGVTLARPRGARRSTSSARELRYRGLVSRGLVDTVEPGADGWWDGVARYRGRTLGRFAMRRSSLGLADETGRGHRAGRGHADRARRALDLAGSRCRRERHRLHRGFRRERVPGPDRGRGEGLRRDLGCAGEGGAADGPQRPARARRGPGGMAGRRPRTGSTRHASGSSSARRSAACRGSSTRATSSATAAPTASRRSSSRACSSTPRAARSRSRSGSAAPTTRLCRRARPARTRSARGRS